MEDNLECKEGLGYSAFCGGASVCQGKGSRFGGGTVQCNFCAFGAGSKVCGFRVMRLP